MLLGSLPDIDSDILNLITKDKGPCEDSQCEDFSEGKHRNLMKLGP